MCKKPYPFKGVQMAFRWRSDGVQKPFGFTQKLRKTLVLGRCVFFDTFTFTRPKWGGSTAIRGMDHPIKLPQTCTSREKVGWSTHWDPNNPQNRWPHQEKWVYWQGFHNLPLFGESLVGVGWLPLTFDLASTLWTQCESFTQFALRIAAGPRGLKYSWNPHHVSGNLKKQRLELWLAGGWSRCLCCSCRAETSAHEWWSDQEVAAGGDRDPPIWG